MPEKNTPNLPDSATGLFLRDDGTWQAAGGSFAGDMDDIPNGTTYVKTENNYTDADAAIVGGVTSALAGKAPSLGSDDNYVTDAEKVVIGNTSGTNTGDNAVNSLYSGLAASKLDTTSFSGLLKISVGTTTPVGPTAGDLWVDTN